MGGVCLDWGGGGVGWDFIIGDGDLKRIFKIIIIININKNAKITQTCHLVVSEALTSSAVGLAV